MAPACAVDYCVGRDLRVVLGQDDAGWADALDVGDVDFGAAVADPGEDVGVVV